MAKEASGPGDGKKPTTSTTATTTTTTKPVNVTPGTGTKPTAKPTKPVTNTSGASTKPTTGSSGSGKPTQGSSSKPSNSTKKDSKANSGAKPAKVSKAPAKPLPPEYVEEKNQKRKITTSKSNQDLELVRMKYSDPTAYRLLQTGSTKVSLINSVLGKSSSLEAGLNFIYARINELNLTEDQYNNILSASSQISPEFYQELIQLAHILTNKAQGESYQSLNPLYTHLDALGEIVNFIQTQNSDFTSQDTLETLQSLFLQDQFILSPSTGLLSSVTGVHSGYQIEGDDSPFNPIQLAVFYASTALEPTSNTRLTTYLTMLDISASVKLGIITLEEARTRYAGLVIADKVRQGLPAQELDEVIVDVLSSDPQAYDDAIYNVLFNYQYSDQDKRAILEDTTEGLDALSDGLATGSALTLAFSPPLGEMLGIASEIADRVSLAFKSALAITNDESSNILEESGIGEYYFDQVYETILREELERNGIRLTEDQASGFYHGIRQITDMLTSD